MIQESKIDVNHVIVQIEGNIVSDMDGEKVMLSIKNGKYYNLGEIGGFIWDHIKEPTSLTTLIEFIQAEYDVAKEQCEKDIVPFLEMLWKEELIEVN